MFAQLLAGHSLARITRALNDAAIPCPSAACLLAAAEPAPRRHDMDACPDGEQIEEADLDVLLARVAVAATAPADAGRGEAETTATSYPPCPMLRM